MSEQSRVEEGECSRTDIAAALQLALRPPPPPLLLSASPAVAADGSSPPVPCPAPVPPRVGVCRRLRADALRAVLRVPARQPLLLFRPAADATAVAAEVAGLGIETEAVPGGVRCYRCELPLPWTAGTLWVAVLPSGALGALPICKPELGRQEVGSPQVAAASTLAGSQGGSGRSGDDGGDSSDECGSGEEEGGEDVDALCFFAGCSSQSDAAECQNSGDQGSSLPGTAASSSVPTTAESLLFSPGALAREIEQLCASEASVRRLR